MTELSLQYPCSPTVGDYGNLTADNLSAIRLALGNFDIRDSGVIYWTDSTYIFGSVSTTSSPAGTITNAVDELLNPTESGGVVSIAEGMAIVNGYMYWNDSRVDFDIDNNAGAANATDIIALRWSDTAQSVRLVRLNGAAASTAVLTQTATQWEIPLCEVELDGSGLFSALVDVRRLAIAPNSGRKLIQLLEPTSAQSSITSVAIPPFFTQLIISANVRGDSFAGTFRGDLQLTGNSAVTYTYSHIEGQLTTLSMVNQYAQTEIPVGSITSAPSGALYPDNFDITSIIIHDANKILGSADEALMCEYKTGTVHGGSVATASDAPFLRNGIGYMFLGSGARLNTLTFACNDGVARNFADGSKIYIYGVT